MADLLRKVKSIKRKQDQSNQQALILGKYEMGRLLGHGTFAKVYLARSAQTGESVAIKVIDKEKVLKSGLIAHIKREISILRRVRHPNIVQLFEVMATKSKIYFVMEYVKGGELFNKVAKGRLKEDIARKYFQQLISAVSFCHFRGVYHRDLKPENLLLDENGNLKVSDFGLSAVSDQIQQDGLFHTFCGTPAYVAPEVLARKGYDGAKVDIWSCGVILFVLMAGFLPFHDRNVMAMYKNSVFLYTLDSGEKCVRITNEVINRNLYRWNSFILGQFHGNLPSHGALHGIFNGIWSSLHKDITVSKVGESVVLIRVPNPETRARIINQGMWSIAGQTMFVAKWTPSLSPALPTMNKVPVWLEFRGVPLHCFSEEALFKIANLVGHPIRLHPTTEQLTNLEVAKVLTVINPNLELPPAVNVQFASDEICRISVSCPWLPPLCSFCKGMGHSQRLCPTAPILCSMCKSKSHSSENCKHPKHVDSRGPKPKGGQKFEYRVKVPIANPMIMRNPDLELHTLLSEVERVTPVQPSNLVKVGSMPPVASVPPSVITPSPKVSLENPSISTSMNNVIVTALPCTTRKFVDVAKGTFSSDTKLCCSDPSCSNLGGKDLGKKLASPELSDSDVDPDFWHPSSSSDQAYASFIRLQTKQRFSASRSKNKKKIRKARTPYGDIGLFNL